MHKTGVVHGGQSSTKFVAHDSGFTGTEPAVAGKHLLECHAANELHPETDSTFMVTGAVDGDHIRVANLGERSCLLQHSGCELLAGM